MAWAWFLVLLAAAAVIAYSIWNFRKKAAAREAASRQRYERLLRAQTPANPRPATAPAPVPVPASPAPASAPAAAATPTAAAPPSRERFLGQPETLLYYLLKTGLPDHEIFANVPLASVIGFPANGNEREQQLRRLAPYQLDFVVCDKNMRIIAAVDVEAGGAADAAGVQQFKADSLKQAGIRLVRVSPAAMPRRDQVRALISGGPGPSGG